MQRQLCALLASTTLLGSVLSGCAPIYYVEDESGPEVYVPDPPPQPRLEVRPPPPGRYYVWIPGRWHWDGGRYGWRPGTYRRIRHKTHRYWVPGVWRSTPRGYVYGPGHWR
jgi:hypothetical protein